MKLLLIFTFLFMSVEFRAQTQLKLTEKQIANIEWEAWKLTKAEIQELPMQWSQKNTDLSGYMLRVASKDTCLGYIYFGRVNCCRKGGCTANSNALTATSFEYFDYYIVFDSAGIVLKTKVTDYQATHGQEICNKQWLRQFAGYRTGNILRYGQEVEAISGATISARAIVEDLQRVSNLQFQKGKQD